MAVRGVASQVVMFDASFNLAADFQNYFLNGRDFTGSSGVSVYNNFQLSPIEVTRSTVLQKFKLVFAGTESNIDLVESAIRDNYLVSVSVWRWSDTEGLENPTSFNLFARTFAAASSGGTNFTTVTLDCSTYNKTANADFPGRKIPWQILEPLQLRNT